MLARQGLVLEVDRTTPPIVFHHGEGFRFEKLPGNCRIGSNRFTKDLKPNLVTNRNKLTANRYNRYVLA